MKKITFTAWAVPLLWMLTSILGSYTLYAQSQPWVVSGVVTDEQSQPLEGVVVWQPHTDSQTLTNELGYYTLSIEKEEAIHFEYLGYQTVVRKASGSVLNVSLKPSDEELDEIIINAGYYNVSDKERTGSISRITAKEISQQPVANPLAAMQGRMAGVNITQNSGVPGGGFDIQIRGRNSLRTEGNAPLYIVDGVPYLSESTSNSNISASILRSTANNPLEQIDPNTIESIEVLKDADATAIYGSRGANGVILITTKKAYREKLNVQYHSNISLGSVPKFMRLLHTKEYIDMRHEAFINDAITEIPESAYDINGTWSKDRYTDWQKVLIGGTAINTQNSLSINGGSEHTKFYVQASTSKDGTVFPGEYGNKKKNIFLQFSHQLDNNKGFLQGQVLRGEFNNHLIGTDLTREALTLAPNAPQLYDEEGNLNWENGTFNNPLRWLNQQYRMKGSQMLSAWIGKYAFSNRLEGIISGGFTESHSNETKLSPHTIYNPNWGLNSSSSNILLSNSKSNQWTLEPQLHYNHSFDKHRLNVIVGTTFLKNTSEQLAFYASNFASNEMLSNISAAKTLQTINNVHTEYAYQAIFGRMNYSYATKYFVNVTGRRDGSSRFGDNKKWGNFGAVGVAWLFSNERIFQNSSILTHGKLRASYGVTGSDRIGDYQYLDIYNYTGNIYDIGGIAPQRLVNKSFGWEANTKKEMALEFALFQDVFRFQISHYYNNTSNQLVGIPLPTTTGFTSVLANLPAEVVNKGWEIDSEVRIIKNDFSWQLGGNISWNKNILKSFPDLEQSTYANQYVIGQPTSIAKVYEYKGFNELSKVYEFKDFNGDGVITAVEDKKKLIDLTPKYTIGIYQNFTYKDWSLSFLLQGVKQLGSNYLLEWPMYGSFANQPIQNIKAQQYPSAGYNNALNSTYNQYMQSDQAFTDASFIRLKNLQITYTLNSKSNLCKTTFLISGQNIYTWTKYKGLDPESQNIGAVPPLRTWSFGININL